MSCTSRVPSWLVDIYYERMHRSSVKTRPLRAAYDEPLIRLKRVRA